MTKGQIIKKLRDSRGMTQVELAERINTTKQNIYKYENGIITNIPSDKIEAIAEIFGVSPGYIMGWDTTENIYEQYDNIVPIKKKQFPLLGSVACGEPIFDEKIDLYVTASSKIKADFALVCKGDSMINARIYDGDVVFIKSQPMVDNGQIAAVSINNEVTLKRVYYYPEKNKLVLNPENSKYEPFIYTNEELNDIRILGKAVAFISNIK